MNTRGCSLAWRRALGTEVWQGRQMKPTHSQDPQEIWKPGPREQGWGVLAHPVGVGSVGLHGLPQQLHLFVLLGEGERALTLPVPAPPSGAHCPLQVLFSLRAQTGQSPAKA